jgi:predicted MFS family arabinose efflux permease
MVVPFIAPYFQYNGGLSERQVMLAYSVAGLSTLIGMNVVGLLTDKFGARRVFAIVATGSIVMTLLITHITPTTLTQGMLLAIGFMLLATGRIVPAQAMMMAAARPAVRGRFSNLNNAVSHLGTGLSAQLAGLMMTGGGESKTPLVGYPLVGEVAACFAVVAIALSFAMKPAEEPTPLAEPKSEPKADAEVLPEPTAA